MAKTAVVLKHIQQMSMIKYKHAHFHLYVLPQQYIKCNMSFKFYILYLHCHLG